MLYLSPLQEEGIIGMEMELLQSTDLLEWLACNYTKYGAALEFITDSSPEGYHFVRTFGGIGGKSCTSITLLETLSVVVVEELGVLNS